MDAPAIDVYHPPPYDHDSLLSSHSRWWYSVGDRWALGLRSTTQLIEPLRNSHLNLTQSLIQSPVSHLNVTQSSQISGHSAATPDLKHEPFAADGSAGEHRFPFDFREQGQQASQDAEPGYDAVDHRRLSRLRLMDEDDDEDEDDEEDEPGGIAHETEATLKGEQRRRSSEESQFSISADFDEEDDENYISQELGQGIQGSQGQEGLGQHHAHHQLYQEFHDHHQESSAVPTIITWSDKVVHQFGSGPIGMTFANEQDIGLIVVEVGGVAAQQGIQTGDLIAEVNGRELPTDMYDDELYEMLVELPRPVAIGFCRASFPEDHAVDSAVHNPVHQTSCISADPATSVVANKTTADDAAEQLKLLLSHDDHAEAGQGGREDETSQKQYRLTRRPKEVSQDDVRGAGASHGGVINGGAINGDASSTGTSTGTSPGTSIGAGSGTGTGNLDLDGADLSKLLHDAEALVELASSLPPTKTTERDAFYQQALDSYEAILQRYPQEARALIGK